MFYVKVLAINRGEAQKVLTTKLVISDRAKNGILSWLNKKWILPNAAGTTISISHVCFDNLYDFSLIQKYSRTALLIVLSEAFTFL